jgi:hypothetical protein
MNREIKIILTYLFRKCEGNALLGKPRHRCEVSIKMDHTSGSSWCSQVSYCSTKSIDVLFRPARLPSASEEGFCTVEDFIASEYRRRTVTFMGIKLGNIQITFLKV